MSIGSGERSEPVDALGIAKCDTCTSPRILVIGNEVVCGDCGMVLGVTNASSEPEWRAFSKEEREQRERTGAPLSQSIHDKGLSTVIGKPRSGASREQKEMVSRIKKWQVRSRIHSSTDRNLIQAMSELSRLSEKLHIPRQVKEKAATVYRQALDKDLVRGRSIAAIVAASLYAACRISDIPRTLSQVASETSVSKKDIARCYRLIVRETEIRMPVPDPNSKISTIASKIGITEATQQLAGDLLNAAKEKKITAGKDPMGLAAAALYIACQLNEEIKTQKAIANAAGVTEVTIRNRYKGLKQSLAGTETSLGLDEIDERFKDFMQDQKVVTTS